MTDVAHEFNIAHSVVSRVWVASGTRIVVKYVLGAREEVVLALRRPKKIAIFLFRQKGSDAAQLVNKQINFVLPQEVKYRGKLLKDVWKRVDYTPEDLLCVSHSRDASVAPVYSGTVCIVMDHKHY